MVDFSTKPKELTVWSFGDAITRDNFLGFLLVSYMVSRGNIAIQEKFFYFSEKKFGFFYKETIENLEKYGSFNALSEEEKYEFSENFKRVKKHHQQFEEFEFEDEIRLDFERLSETLAKTNPLSNQEYTRMSGISCIADFIAYHGK